MRNWTQIGQAEGFSKGRIEAAILNMEWTTIPKTMPMSQGLGIKAAIKELRIPKVSHIADSNQLAPYGFYGIRAHYANGDADIYIVDRGSDLIPVCSDFTPKVGA